MEKTKSTEDVCAVGPSCSGPTPRAVFFNFLRGVSRSPRGGRGRFAALKEFFHKKFRGEHVATESATPEVEST